MSLAFESVLIPHSSPIVFVWAVLGPACNKLNLLLVSERIPSANETGGRWHRVKGLKGCEQAHIAS